MHTSSGMNDLLERLVSKHREEWAKRERVMLAELARRRREVAERAAVDVDALRIELAI